LRSTQGLLTRRSAAAFRRTGTSTRWRYSLGGSPTSCSLTWSPGQLGFSPTR
jgi:hypothetical protein